jgi:lipoprotein-anchoring transpeptidase ErfK/SrfK
VVDTTGHFLYLVQPGGRAIRYGVGLGRAGFEWSGNAVVQWKQKWPKWTPPDEMIARQPELTKYSAKNGGMPGGLMNPLGARALYLFQNGKDTLYRLHGSPEWNSIGKSVSSGCVRLMNQDIIDLYSRVPAKTPVIVTGDIGQPMAASGRFHRAIAIDAGVPQDAELLGPAQ